MVLDNGCICCTIRGDLAETLRTVESQTDLRAFDRIVIETTGLADPIPILHTLLVDPTLSSRYRIGDVVTTVDAVNGIRTLDEFPEAVKQLSAADSILLTKADLVDADGIAAILARIRYVNPMGRLAASVDDVLGGGDTPWLERIAALTQESQDQACGHPDCTGVHATDHLHGQYETMAFTIDQPIDWTAFSQWLDYLTSLQGERLLRFKGIVCATRNPARPVAIHGVQHILHPPVELSTWPTEDQRTRLVFIAKDLPRAIIERTLAKFGAVQTVRAVA